MTRKAFEVHPLKCQHCGAKTDAKPATDCDSCSGILEPLYDPMQEKPARPVIEARPHSLWRYHEWLPFSGDPPYSKEVGFTPLVEVPSLARLLGVRRIWVKNDSVSSPSLSFKDRVVAVALNAAHGLGLDTVACASTGNLGNALAAQATRAGIPARILIPEDIEVGKTVGTAIYGSKLIRVRGTFDDIYSLCGEIADRFRWGFVNLNLRSYYGEGAKTLAFETAEQLGWRLPSAVVAPMAGGCLVTNLRKGFGEFLADGIVTGGAPRVFGVQAAGCAPIVRLIERGSGGIMPVRPTTIARSIAIGNPTDGERAARVVCESGGWGAAVSDEALVRGIQILAEHAGIFTETAGGVTMAGALSLARVGRLTSSDEVVLYITGNGQKTIEAVESQVEELGPINTDLDELVEAATALSA